ncbi:ribonuclease P protein component [Caldimonas tepidiphila]|uniref:ribonuclease P protein component n=1 Tax=Caldimonas tepidiphila TaxID=2315841 RepID=UPI0013007928|nr:ribonuclease P protein component [Caldimonas tepidiphila]
MLNRALPPLGRLKDKADFESALDRGQGRVLAKSPHFVVHYSPVLAPPRGKLSTGEVPLEQQPVDDLQPGPASPPSAVVRVGAVLPKRLARRAVTRNLLKRQIHAAAARALPQLRGGAWVLRLRSPIDKAEFPSAASDALRHAVREELDALLAQAAKRLSARGAPPPAHARPSAAPGPAAAAAD